MHDAIGRFDLLPPGTRVLCALSGGADSVCMTHLLADLAGQLGITVAAAHFSHGIRPESAESERELCQRLCDRLDILLVCGKGDTPAYAKAHGLGLEEGARHLRRQFLLENAQKLGCTAIATGHHLEDSAETLLFNLARGTGRRGMQGIPPKEGLWVRPLILWEKDEIYTYIRENGLEYAQDPTNFTGDNARALMRRQVFPALEQMNRGAARHLAESALDTWLRDEDIRMEVRRLTSCLDEEEGEVRLDIPRLLSASQEAAARTLQTMQRKAGGHMLERPHIQAVLALCRGDDPSARADLPGTRAVRRYDRLILTGKTPETPQSARLLPGKPVTFGPWQVSLTEDRTAEGFELWLEPEMLPLTVRSRQGGDGIFLGFGTKSVKKLLMERKIPKDLRDKIPIVCHNNKILAVGALCAVKQREKTGRAMRLCIRRKTL